MIEEMAKTANLSWYHLIRMLKKAFGLTPHQFRILCKVRKTQTVLEKNKNIGDAAFEAGFYDESHMDRCFQKIVSMTPGEYIDGIEK